MNEYEIKEKSLKHVCKEIEETIEMMEKNGRTDQLLQRLDILYHTKKDILSSWGMEHPEEYGMSGERGRSAVTGRYISREQGSYEDGYANGYSAAMNNSGQHWSQSPYRNGPW